jgi:predicted phosphodiesterase
MGAWPAGKGPLCARCQTNRVKDRSAKMCGACRYQVDPIAPPPSPVEPLASFEDAWKQWQRAIGMAKDRYIVPSRRSKATTKRKILVLPDIHAPFHAKELLARTIEENPDVDEVFCIGDVCDSYALSRFTKYDWMPWRDEWAQVTLVMQAIASAFPKVTIVVGNHDARLEKQLRTHLSQDMVEAIQYMTGGTLCPLTALARRYPNVTIARHITPSGHAVDWCTTVGDAWLGHPEKFSRTPGAALRGVEEWLADNELQMGFDRYRLIVLGHTHQLSVFPWRAQQLLVECGCLCATQGYMTSPRIGGRPQRRGYITFTQVNGKTDLNSVRMRWFDAELQVA